MESDTASSSTSIVPYRTSVPLSTSSPDCVPLLMENATTNAEDGKLWPLPVEKYFIDVLVEEELRGNMPQGQFKTKLWTSIVREFNLHADKNYNKEQLRQKYQRLKVRHRVFSQLLERAGMGWDPVVKTVVGSDVAWASAITANH